MKKTKKQKTKQNKLNKKQQRLTKITWMNIRTLGSCESSIKQGFFSIQG